MLLNRAETLIVNNPVRAVIQHRLEAGRLLRMGGALAGGRALEMGCGRGIGVDLILSRFGADSVDAFDLDPRMIELARRRLVRHGSRVRLWVGDAAAIEAEDAGYDAVFDFGIVHHVPRWRRVPAEIHRVLKPGGRFYADEVFARLIDHPVARSLLEHPREDRFDGAEFARELEAAGLEVTGHQELWGCFGWFTARKPETD